jgi:hypothetical protein
MGARPAVAVQAFAVSALLLENTAMAADAVKLPITGDDAAKSAEGYSPGPMIGR